MRYKYFKCSIKTIDLNFESFGVVEDSEGLGWDSVGAAWYSVGAAWDSVSTCPVLTCPMGDRLAKSDKTR